MTEAQPTLTDDTVALRPWRDEDVDVALAGHDEVIGQWSDAGTDGPTRVDLAESVSRWRAGFADDRRVVAFVVERAGEAIGTVEVTRTDPGVGRLTWALFAGHRGRGSAARAVRLVTDWALTESGQAGLGLTRVEARIDADNDSSLRVATRAGLRREGVSRVAPGTGDRKETTGYVVLARLASDPPITEPESFRALLNSFLPRKRAIGQMLIRDGADRVLLCRLTYKQDWDLPGGVVEVGESPQLAVTREVGEELGLEITAGTLLLTDWLPPWGGWDDALCLVFDGGVHDAEILDSVVRQEREIRDVAFCDPTEVRRRAADFTARRVEASLSALADGSARYTESGR